MTTASQTPKPLNDGHPATPTAVRAASGIIRAAMERGAATPDELAQAEHDAGLLFDAESTQDIDSAAREQAHAEDAADIEGLRAELQAAREELAGMAGANRQRLAGLRLIEARPGTYKVPAAEIGAALEYGTTPYDAFPMTLTWSPEDGVDVPGPGDTGRRAIVHCRSVHGQLADLVVEGDDRTKLASLIGTEYSDIHAPCPTEGCGAAEAPGASYPLPDGWSRLEIPSTGTGMRAYCCDMCVIDALARAGHDLADTDQAAAVDPHQQGHSLDEDEDEAVRRSVDRAFPAVAAFLADDRDVDRAAAVDAATTEALEAEAHRYPEAVIEPAQLGCDMPYGGDLLAEETRSYPEAALDGADDRAPQGGAW